MLLEGPAGTGKSRAAAEYIRYYCEKTPGVLVLVFRKTRVSLNDSWLRTWESEVLGDDHPVVQNGPSRAHRASYKFPNGSEVVLGGMDNPTRLFSTQYDLAYANEATELTEDEFQSIHRALRRQIGPYRQLIADCNPDAENHWLNQRAIRGDIHRIRTVHKDNPACTPEYLTRLSKLRGVMRRRLYLGEWVSAEGLIWENYDPNLHLVERFHDGEPVIPRMVWHFGSMDFGWRDPGVLQVWGVDEERRMYRLVEIYRCEMQLEWWANQVKRLYDDYNLQAVVCDPSRPDMIALINERLGWRRGMNLDFIARPADNRRKGSRSNSKTTMGGLDMVRWGLEPDESGIPRILIIRDAHECYPCPVAEKKNVVSLEDEIQSYVWAPPSPTKPDVVIEEPKPGVPDHACDAMRYAAMFLWGNDLAPVADEPTFPDESLGSFLGYDKLIPAEDWQTYYA